MTKVSRIKWNAVLLYSFHSITVSERFFVIDDEIECVHVLKIEHTLFCYTAKKDHVHDRIAVYWPQNMFFICSFFHLVFVFPFHRH